MKSLIEAFAYLRMFFRRHNLDDDIEVTITFKSNKARYHFEDVIALEAPKQDTVFVNPFRSEYRIYGIPLNLKVQ